MTSTSGPGFDLMTESMGLATAAEIPMVIVGEIIEALKENGIRDKIKVLIGGTAVSGEYAQEIGADAYCVDGFHAINVLDAFQDVKT